jgi:hypothetical protein
MKFEIHFEFRASLRKFQDLNFWDATIIKSFRQILKQRRGKDYKPRSKKVCYKCGKPGHFIAKCPLSSDSDRGDDKKEKRREKKRYYKKKGGDAHVCR